MPTPNLNKYATKTLKNDCIIHLGGSKLCRSLCPIYSLLRIKAIAASRVQITKQAVAILISISGNDLKLIIYTQY